MSNRGSNGFTNFLMMLLFIVLVPFRFIAAILGFGVIGIVAFCAIAVALFVGLTAGINWGYLAVMILVLAGIAGGIYGAVKFIKSKMNKSGVNE